MIIREDIEPDTYSGSGLKHRTHTNGGQWEHRIFACGQGLDYIPNFSATEQSKYNICTNNDEYKLQQYKEQKFKEATKQFMLSYKDVNDSCKQNLIDRVRI